MSRNLVICCDGTNNQFGPQKTNVVRLIQALDRDPTQQRLYYDPGVGTLPEPNVSTKLGKSLSQVRGLAFGGGLTRNLEEAYSYLMDYWEPGDRVFLFGFSRGAYTVRVLAGLLHALGLLPRGNQNLVPYVMRLFKAVKGARNGTNGQSEYWKLCQEFRWSFARQVTEGDDDRRFPVHFLGVWDTVSSVGWVWDPAKFPFTAHNPSIAVIRHAVSVDERRWFFRQNLMHQVEGQNFEELWFPGVHSDVGGGYPENDGGLWRKPFEWILGEAQKAGLLVNPPRLTAILSKAPPPASLRIEPKHESLKGGWWIAEFFPKLRRRPGLSLRVPQLGLGRHRHIEAGVWLDESTLLRIQQDLNYEPPNLSKRFIDYVRSLPSVTGKLPYKP